MINSARKLLSILSMKNILDFRSLGAEAQEQIRLRAIDAVAAGTPQVAVAKIFHISYVSVCRWMKRRREGGNKALKAKPRGTHKKGGILAPVEQAWVAKAINDHSPEQMNLPFSVWSREAVGALIEVEFGKKLAVRTVGDYLARWDFTPQRPARRAYERNSQEVQRFRRYRYPAIDRSAREHGAKIFWEDEVGFRSYANGGKSYSPRGRTPVIEGSGKRFGCNMASAIDNNGYAHTMLFTENFCGDIFIEFLTRLINSVAGMTYLMIDSHPVHISGKVSEWFKHHRDRIRAFFIPGYSPELNPDEMLNNDVKTNAVSRRRPHNQSQLVTLIREVLRKRVHSNRRIKSYFHESHVLYAARKPISPPD
jgi:transposase